MPRYDRLVKGTESSRDCGVLAQNVGENRIAPDETSSRHNNKVLTKRISYTSIESDEEGYLNSQDEDEHGSMEQSPFRNKRSFASDDHSVGDNDLTPAEAAFRTRSNSPGAIYPSIASCYSDSFDLDDDDEDDVLEANLKRYNLDFSSTDRIASLPNGSVNDENLFARGTENSSRCSKVVKYLWFSFQSIRQQARERRAQLLLQQTERDWRQSLKICVLTNCDATDSGILIVVAIMVVWILAVILVKDSNVRGGGIVLGILFFIIRVGTRPLYHFCLRQRQRRQFRHRQLEEFSQNSLGRKTLHKNGQHHHLGHPDGTLELHDIQGNVNSANRFPTASVDSDPTIAAI